MATRRGQGKVGLISGGGSGHEPLHGGFVGEGMLDAACCGEVFTSPVPDQIVAATKGVDGGAGVLHIVKNYTGDVMNFEMAAELCAADSGVEVQAVVTDDDVAVQDSLYTVGRRGVGVTVLVEKIAGAAAEQGRNLAEVADIARKVNAGGRSMGMALTSCTVPMAGKPTFDLPEDEMEVGIGIHGEPGRVRVPVAPAAEIAQMLVEPILDDHDFGGDGGVLAFVNGMGGTPLIELYLMYHEVDRLLAKAGRPRRALARRELHHQPRHGRLLGHPAAPRRRPAPAVGRSGQDACAAVGRVTVDEHAEVTTMIDATAVRSWLEAFAAGGGGQPRPPHPAGRCDRGRRPRRQPRPRPHRCRRRSRRRRRTDARRRAQDHGHDAGQHGRRGERPVVRHALPADVGQRRGRRRRSTRTGFAAALRAGLEGVVARGKAQAEDKTMYDALAPACDALDAALAEGADLGAALARASAAADAGRDATTPMLARKGRASYLGERSVGHQDPGATSTALLVATAARTLAPEGPP